MIKGKIDSIKCDLKHIDLTLTSAMNDPNNIFNRNPPIVKDAGFELEKSIVVGATENMWKHLNKLSKSITKATKAFTHWNGVFIQPLYTGKQLRKQLLKQMRNSKRWRR